MKQVTDYYAVLGVDANAPTEVIKKAFKHLALQYHPDIYKGEDAQERMREILLAYQTLIDSDVEAVASRLMILQEGRVLSDTTPEALLAHTAGHVWSVITDQATALQLQASYQVSTMVNQMNGITLRIVSATRPHEAAVVIDPSLEEAYLLATGRQEVRV